MPSAAFTTLGCKVNQYETQRILDSFEREGFVIVPFESRADVYVINSCSVTSAAESKSRYAIRRATRNNPDAKVVVTGCAAQMAINKSEAIEFADVVVPNPEKLNTLEYFLSEYPEYRSQKAREVAVQPTAVKRTRATLKVQDGCNVFCSYCSIPFTRPVLSSRDWRDVLEEAKSFSARGYEELILTGVLIGAYDASSGSGGPNFEDLIEILAEHSGVARLRISSIEMRQVTPRLIGLLQSNIVVPHLHIPLQAGDDSVLRDMNRPYTQKDFLELCAHLYAAIPQVSITTDVLVGFPTETEERFASTMHVFETARFLKAHIFRFSPRYGTLADQWGDPIPDAVKQDRSARLSAIAKRTALEHGQKFVGQSFRVLVESKQRRDGLLEGLTDNYLNIAFAGSESLRGKCAFVRLLDWHGESGIGEVTASLALNQHEMRILA